LREDDDIMRDRRRGLELELLHQPFFETTTRRKNKLETTMVIIVLIATTTSPCNTAD
jgi:hypothetical protein